MAIAFVNASERRVVRIDSCTSSRPNIVLRISDHSMSADGVEDIGTLARV